MAGKIRIIAHPTEPPDVRLYVLALIALARQQLKKPEDAAQSERPQEAPHG